MRTRGLRRATSVGACVMALMCAGPGGALAATGLTLGTTAPAFTKTALGGGPVSLGDYAGRVVVLFLFSPGCTFCNQDAPSVEANIHQYYDTNRPGQVVVLGI